jgi:hypothetical protein
MYAYRICDLLLASNVQLPELPQVNLAEAECWFELLPEGEPALGDFAWFQEWRFDESEEGPGEPWVRFGRCGDGYLLRFPSCGDFLVSLKRAAIQCRPLPGIPQVTVRHLLLDQVVPLVLSRRERIVLHASAVLTKHGVIALAARSGLGKSTLAASLAKTGCAIVSDDCLVLRRDEIGWIALPSYPGVRLWAPTLEKLLQKDIDTVDVAHYTGKRRISDPKILPFTTTPGRMLSLFFLADDQPEIRIKRIPAVQACVKLVECSYNLDVTDAAFLHRQFDTVGQMASDVSAYSIHYPREFGSLRAVKEAILDQIEEDRHSDTE